MIITSVQKMIVILYVVALTNQSPVMIIMIAQTTTACKIMGVCIPLLIAMMTMLVPTMNAILLPVVLIPKLIVMMTIGAQMIPVMQLPVVNILLTFVTITTSALPALVTLRLRNVIMFQ
jgi:hypothetical protein